MVRHGRNKKRRAGRIGKTKLKNYNYTRWNPKPKIKDPTVSKLWDVTKSPHQNFAAMGLTLEPNRETLATYTSGSAKSTTSSSSSSSSPDSSSLKKPNMIELFDVPASDSLNPQQARRLPLQADEQIYIVQCMKKYGTDYDKMFRDVRLNTLQHTRDKLQKMSARFLLLEPHHIKVPREDIPEPIWSKMSHHQNRNADSSGTVGTGTIVEEEKEELKDPSCTTTKRKKERK